MTTTTIETTEVQASEPSLTITADRAELASAVTWASKGIGKRVHVPTLAGMRLQVTAGTLELAGFDYDMTCTARVAGSDASDGMLLVNGAMLLAAVKSLPKVKGPQKVTLQADQDSLTVACDGITSRLPLLDISEYPSLPPLPPLAGMADASALAAVVGRVAPAAGRDDTLPSLTCVRFAFGDALELAATDRYRAHAESLPWVADGEAPDVLIPAKPLSLAAKEMAKHGVISLHVGRDEVPEYRKAALATETRTLITRTCNPEQFLKSLDKLWPQATDEVTADGPALAAAVKRAAAHLDRHSTAVTLECEPGRIVVVASVDGSDAYREPVAAHGVPGCTLRARFSPAYLADALASAGGALTLGLTAPELREALTASGHPSWSYKPVSVTPESGEFRAIVMRIAHRGDSAEAAAEAASYRTDHEQAA